MIQYSLSEHIVFGQFPSYFLANLPRQFQLVLQDSSCVTDAMDIRQEHYSGSQGTVWPFAALLFVSAGPILLIQPVRSLVQTN